MYRARGRVAWVQRGRYRRAVAMSDIVHDLGVRQARLRSAYADRYPGIDPEVWFTAATLAEHLDFRRARGDEEGPPSGPRSLAPAHFEFQGGEKPVGVRVALGRRLSD
jgi:hypothetical protein